MKTEQIQLDPIQGHLLYYIKGHYDVKDVDFLTGLRRIWAVRCGLMDEHTSNGQADEHIADDLLKILIKTSEKNLLERIQNIHREMARPSFQYADLKSIEHLIMLYRSEIWGVTVRNKKNGRYRYLIKLPKHQKRVMKRIINGNGVYNDYYAISK